MQIKRDSQFYRFAAYGFLKNLRFFDPFLILFFREMGLSFLQIGTLISVREVATNFLELPTGIIADLYGRRLSMVLSMVSYLSSFIV
ncbi:MAG TPA: MFS transporter, partial [Mesotoga sp.]|nr:MFS transporter [Mesotoga sp.]